MQDLSFGTQAPEHSPSLQILSHAALATHWPVALQVEGTSPSHFLVPGLQSPLQRPSLVHRPLGQVVAAGFVHVPAPSQVEAGVTTPLAQVAGAHTVLSPGNAQVFPSLPSQVPLHDPVPEQPARAPTGAPETGWHVPTEPDSLHDSHWPSHSVSQQTPSTEQLPELHCELDEQIFPLASVGTQAPLASQ